MYVLIPGIFSLPGKPSRALRSRCSQVSASTTRAPWISAEFYLFGATDKPTHFIFTTTDIPRSPPAKCIYDDVQTPRSSSRIFDDELRPTPTDPPHHPAHVTLRAKSSVRDLPCTHVTSQPSCALGALRSEPVQ